MSNVSAPTLNDKYLRLFGIPISVIAFMLSQMPFFYPGRWDIFWKYATISLVFTVSIWEISRQIILRVRWRFPNLAQTKFRIGWMLLLFALLMAIGQAIITQPVRNIGIGQTNAYSFFQIWLINFICGFFFIIVLSGIYEAAYFFSQYKSAIYKAEALKKQQAQQQLNTLKNRVNPHFLFNSLTTLSALIGEDPRRAEHFVDELSKVYRYLLRAGRQPVATLGEELQFAESYVFLLKNRFEKGAFSLQVFQAIPFLEAELDQNIPVLTLQNALDYLVRTQNIPLHIRVESRDRNLCISCANHPKTLSFDLADNDWRQLKTNGAIQTVQSGQLTICIPFISNMHLI